jgi:hypothetical protein
MHRLRERIEALEQRPISGSVELAAPTLEPAPPPPVATDKELEGLFKGSVRTWREALRAAYDLGCQHGAAQPAPMATDGPNDEVRREPLEQQSTCKQSLQVPPDPAPPTGGLVERVAHVIGDDPLLPCLWEDDARAAIREVAAWLFFEGFSIASNKILLEAGK